MNIVLEKEDIFSLIALNVKTYSIVSNKIIVQALENDEVKEYVLLNTFDFVKILKNQPYIFLSVFNSKYGYDWFKEQVKENKSTFIKWIDDYFSNTHKTKFKKNNKTKLINYKEIKTILVDYVEKLTVEDFQLMKDFFETEVILKKKSRIEVWINLFDNSEYIFNSGIINIFDESKKLKCMELLDWSQDLFDKVIKNEKFIEKINEPSSKIIENILNNFNNFSQFKKISKLIPLIENYFEINQEKLIQTIDLISILIQKDYDSSKIKEETKQIIINTIDVLLTEIINLKSYKNDELSKKEIEKLFVFLEKDEDFKKVILKISLESNLNYNSKGKEVKFKV